MGSQKTQERLLKLVKLLSEHQKGLTLAELAKKLKISDRTVRRDLAVIARAGLTFKERTGPHGVKYRSLESKEKVSSLFPEKRKSKS